MSGDFLAPWRYPLGVTHLQKFAVTLILSSMAGALFIGLKVIQYQSMSPVERLNLDWANDLKTLSHQNLLPKEWAQISEIKIEAGTDKAKAWVPHLNIPINKRDSGGYRLEVLLISWKEGTKGGALIQYHLVNKESNNTIWELGRTFDLSPIFPKRR